MKVLITGVAGFIGSNLAERLLGEGHTVFGVDNMSHGKSSNMDECRRYVNFTWGLEDASVFDPDEEIDAIVHLASEKIPRYSDSFGTLSHNYKMTEQVVKLALKYKARLLFASTSDIYGLNETAPFSEDSRLVMGNTDVKRWAYAVSKMHSEHYIIGSHDKDGLGYTIMRFFSCYGKNQASGWWGGAQSVFIENILRGKEVQIHGSGMQSRCFTYIDDVIDGIMLCLIKEEANNQIFNLGNPSAYVTIYGLYKLISGLVDKYAPVTYMPYSELGKYEDSKMKIPDITKAKSILGFEPKVGLYDGIVNTINWHKKQYNHE